MPTTVQSGSAAANKLFNAALFVEATRRNSLVNILTDNAPQSAQGNKMDSSKQTAAGAPVVRVTDLSKQAGEEVTVDLFHQLRQKPVMGDDKLAGKGASLTSAQFSLKINQGRTMVDSGGRMAQQRTKHDLRRLAKTLMGPYYNRLEDQISHIHLAGARGSHNDADWIVPTENDPDFAKILVNSVTPPTFDRHMYGGDATALTNLDSADKFDLDTIDRARLTIDEMPFPIQPIRMEGDQQADDNPFYCILVSPRQWYDFWTSTDGNVWRTLKAEAHQRSQGFNHPVFRGECIMWNNILVRKSKRPIRFETTDSVTVCTNTADAQTTTVNPAVRSERAILLGAQALANAFGMSGKKDDGGYHFNMTTEDTDHGNVQEHSICWMNGKAKIRFKGTDGRINDHGVMAIDTAVSG